MANAKPIVLRIATSLTLAGAAGCLFAGVAAADVTVRMWTFLDPTKASPREVALKTMIQNFETAHPGVRIKVEPQIYSELGVKFLLGHKTSNAPDVVFVNTSNLGAIVRSGAAADLQDLFVKNWSDAEEKDFFIRAGWDAALEGGKRYAVPLFHATEAIFYRKDLFDAAGIDPATLKTWDAFAVAAKKLTKDGVSGFGTPLSTEKAGGTQVQASMIVAGQGDAWDRDACKARYATDIGTKATQWVADLISRDRVMPKEALVATSDDIMDQFSAGRYASVLAPFARFSKAKKEATWDSSQLRVLRFPNFTADKPGSHRVAGWWVSAWSKSPHLKEAAMWVEHMINKDSVELWSKVGGQIPTRTSVLNDPVFQTADFAHVREIHAAWSASSWMLPVNCNTQRFDADLNGAVHRVVLGETSAKDALDEAEKKFAERQ